jgi:HK97 family phage prohead protease
MRDRLTRAYVTNLEEDGRTILGRCVPYNVPALVRDGPNLPPYEEIFAAGAFKRITTEPGRVRLTYEHPDKRGGGTVADQLGRAVEMRDEMDGLHGAFRVVESDLGDHALALVREKIVTGLSVDFEPISARRGPGGRIIRTRCHLIDVSLTRDPAYEGAEVAMVRSASVVDLSEYRAKPNPELDARIARLAKPEE